MNFADQAYRYILASVGIRKFLYYLKARPGITNAT